MVLALTFGQGSSLDILRDMTLSFACNYRYLVELLRGPCYNVYLFKASMLGDLEKVKTILAADNSGCYARPEPFPPFKMDTMLDISAWGAIAGGFVEVLKELLCYEKKFCSALTRKERLLEVVALASMANNIPMAVDVLIIATPQMMHQRPSASFLRTLATIQRH